MNDKIKNIPYQIITFILIFMLLILPLITIININIQREKIKNDLEEIKKQNIFFETEIFNLYDEFNQVNEIFEEHSKKILNIEENIESLQVEEDIKNTIENTIEKNLIPTNIPNLDCSFKSYMDYKYITDTTSDQYKLQQNAYTDEYGLRKIEEYYCVAMGTFYSSVCGAKFQITTDKGNVFNVIVGDIKANEHTDETNRYVPMSNGKVNIIEFIVDTNKLDSYVRRLGDISGYDYFAGNIIKIERIQE